MTTKVPAELSSTPSIVDNGNSQALTIDSSEQIGIGTTAPNDYDNNAAGISSNLVVKDSGHSGIIVISGTGSDAAISFGDGTGTAAYRGAVAYVNSADALYFKAGGNNKLRLDSDGLKFGLDTAAANALDDYEEGTFDAHFRDANNGNILVSATGNGRYTKIGRFVHVTIQIYQNGVSSTTLSSGYNYIEMPFTTNSNFNATTFLPMYYGGIGNIKAGYLSSNTNRLFLCTSRDNILTSLAGTEVVGGYVRLYGDLTFII